MIRHRPDRRSLHGHGLTAVALVVFGMPTFAAQEPDLPRVDGVEAVASVNGEPITLDDLVQQVAAAHRGIEETTATVALPDPRALLDRLINVRLILQEAQNIGLDELPEVPAQLAAQRLELVRDMVVKERVKDIQRGDPQMIERLFQDAVREFRVESVLFSSIEAATSFVSSLSSPERFGEEAAALAASGKALAYHPPESIRASRLQPDVRDRLFEVPPGGLSPAIQLQAGVTVIRLLEVRYPEDAAARAEAERQALERKQQAALGEYATELRSRYATVDNELVASLDYDAPGADLAALRTDARIVARIDGGEPITVGELTTRMEKKMFHGLEHAAEQGRANESAGVTLDRLIQEHAILVEAKRMGILDTAEFRRALQTARDGLLFGKFVSKVIDPTVKISDEELHAYLAEHLEEYSDPEMMGIESLAFRRREDAQAALQKLRQGADLKWMRANSTGQIPREEIDPSWRFDGTLLPVTGLPPNVRDAVAGAVGGDYRFCEEPGGASYQVLWVTRQFPSSPRPFEEVKQQIAVQVFDRKRKEVLDDWTERLRKASDVQVFVDVGQMRTLLGLGTAEGA